MQEQAKNRNRAGHIRKNLSDKLQYFSFVPAALPPEPSINITADMLELLVEANSQLAVLENVTSRIPNMDLFISMYVRKEALLSSQIEGTQATLEDVFDPLIETNANRDVTDVINYIKATEFATKKLKELPLCNRLLKQTHSV